MVLSRHRLGEILEICWVGLWQYHTVSDCHCELSQYACNLLGPAVVN